MLEDFLLQQDALAVLVVPVTVEVLLALAALLLQQLDLPLAAHSSLALAAVVTVALVFVEALADDFLCSSHFIPADVTVAANPKASSVVVNMRIFISGLLGRKLRWDFLCCTQ